MLCQLSREVPADCAPAEEVSSYDLLWDSFGASGDFYGDFWASMVCGPVESITDECCYVLTDFDFMEWAEGRPFTVAGQARIADCDQPNGWSQSSDWAPPTMSESDRTQLLSYWTETAQFEHASVASFARFSMQLMAIGAPAGLVAEATRAQADEIRHARIALGIASALADHELGLGQLPIDGALDDAGDVRSILVDTIREACVNETVSAAQCQAAGEAAKDPFIKRALLDIAKDEQRHATLAWKTVRWILETHPELRDIAADSFAEAMSRPWAKAAHRGSELSDWGVLSGVSEQAVARRVIRQVVRPCAEALLGPAEVATVEA